MRGSKRVSDQHLIAVPPVPVLNQWELAPNRAVRDQRMPVKVGRENALAIGSALGIRHARKPYLGEGGSIAFNDEGAHCRAISIVMGDKTSGNGLAESQSESVEQFGRAVPGETIG